MRVSPAMVSSVAIGLATSTSKRLSICVLEAERKSIAQGWLSIRENRVIARSLAYSNALKSSNCVSMLFICLNCDKEFVHCMACHGQQEYHIRLYSQTTSIQRLGGGFTIKKATSVTRVSISAVRQFVHIKRSSFMSNKLNKHDRSQADNGSKA